MSPNFPAYFCRKDIKRVRKVLKILFGARIFVFLMMQFIVIAQDEYIFNVATLPGNTKLSTDIILKSGDKILRDDTIVIGINSYLALLYFVRGKNLDFFNKKK